jgi:hypothetical protein
MTTNKKIASEEEDRDEKLRRLLPFEEAPHYLKYNPYILNGYRNSLTTKLCLERLSLIFLNIFANLENNERIL